MAPEVSFIPAWPAPDGPGSSFVKARVSKRWPGAYVGRCVHCTAHFIAAKRAISCDDCETARLKAIELAGFVQEARDHREAKEAAIRERTINALREITERLVDIGNSVDDGWKDPEKDPVIIEARAVIEMLGEAA
jgi:hypothetical protein